LAQTLFYFPESFFKKRKNLARGIFIFSKHFWDFKKVSEPIWLFTIFLLQNVIKQPILF